MLDSTARNLLIFVAFLFSLSGCGGSVGSGSTVIRSGPAAGITVSATIPIEYNWGTLTSGADVYIDRNYTYTTIPAAYEGSLALKTADDDKNSSGDTFISYNVDQAITVYVAHVDNGTNLPVWLSSWNNTGDILTTTDRNLFVYEKDFAAGTVTLGGNGGAPSMYTAFIVGDPSVSIVSLSANPTTVVTNGSTTLNWSSTNTTDCTASGDWFGSKATSGSQTITGLITDSNFNLSCTGASGSVNDSVSVTVVDPSALIVNLSASPSSVAYNGSTSLSWSSNNVTSCTASGGWSGSMATSGSQTINALITNSNFTLTCSGANGPANDTVSVTVAPPVPSVNLSASPSSVAQNGSTTLSWTSNNVTSCTASGDWSGTMPTSGSQTINALITNSNFTLTCSGANGSASDLVNVTVVLSNNGTALLSWVPPTENTDGSTLTDLAGYKVYYGTSSGSYGAPITINDPGLSSYMVENLGISDWFFVITAFNSSGIESSYSTETSKTIN